MTDGLKGEPQAFWRMVCAGQAARAAGGNQRPERKDGTGKRVWEGAGRTVTSGELVEGSGAFGERDQSRALVESQGKDRAEWRGMKRPNGVASACLRWRDQPLEYARFYLSKKSGAVHTVARLIGRNLLYRDLIAGNGLSPTARF